ncbi:hypothetical protein Lser_V15G45527 [Lactuca serriola]
MYQIDVHKMHTHPILKGMKFDIIIFNFAHAGHICYLREHDTELIQKHKELVGAYVCIWRSWLIQTSVGYYFYFRWYA